MAMQFNPEQSATGEMSLIPAGTLAWAFLSVEDATKTTKPNEEKGTKGGGSYFWCKLTVMDGPYAKRTIFHSLFDPEDMLNSEGARTMGFGQLIRMLEAVGVFDHTNLASYKAMDFRQAVGEILRANQIGRPLALEIGIQKGTGGYSDKNVIRNFLTPNPKSDTFKKWANLQAGIAGGTPVRAAMGVPQGFQAPTGGGFFLGGAGVSAFKGPAATGAIPTGGAAKPGWLGGGEAPKAGASTTDDDLPY